MKIAILFMIVLNLLGNALQNLPIDKLTRDCAEKVPARALLEHNRLFFTMPSEATSSSLNLWVAQGAEIVQTPVSFPASSVIAINPGEDYIVAVIDQDRMISEEEGSVGAFLTKLTLVRTQDFEVEDWVLPQQITEIPFVSVLGWIGNDVFLMRSALEYKKVATVNVADRTVTLEDWPDLEGLELPQHGGGRISVSPNGTYILYTTLFPLIGMPPGTLNEEYFSPPFDTLSWRIVDRQGNGVLEHIAGFGRTAGWLPDSSGIVVYDRDDGLIKVGLDGQITPLISPETGYFWGGLINHTGTGIAFTMSAQEGSDPSGFALYSLAVLDLNHETLTDYCLKATHLGKRDWSANDALLAYKNSFIRDNAHQLDIQILNVETGQYASILPFAVEDTGSDFDAVRVVGFQEIK